MIRKTTLVALALLAMWYASPAAAALSDDKVKEQIIQESIDDYSGNCPCPYNTMRNGRACGGRSAWSREGGASPVCYKREVTAEMIREWRERNE
ncbi:hypothetical protein SOJ80_003378 [Cronobacter universalis]|uniref:Hemolysin n=1 Tax=Cronobacter universalis NCTC 9529 TaxID=1074000 RepID=A0AAC8ZSM3_9ENTR|nr:hypothetical protein [Cronobacter universalis]ALB56885.1 hypothetical protein AFK65_05710 [Cronobacter universalis NCTC 9529]ELY3468106.1 hypothetical protein [Cronobacter universalis]ELY3759552.1 hypothetical protein [Cronobacter universalis]ELY7393146.1 hypothetical protein [Cronobacter universalis]CCK15736.1 FIG00554073: hypothetical protein [Cronobacter universalis NCTC 9529]